MNNGRTFTIPTNEEELDKFMNDNIPSDVVGAERTLHEISLLLTLIKGVQDLDKASDRD